MGPDNNVYPITGVHIGSTAPPMKYNPLGDYTMEDADENTAADTLLANNPVNVVFDKGWLFDVNASEPLFFPGPDNREQHHDVPAPLRRLVHPFGATFEYRRMLHEAQVQRTASGRTSRL